MNGYIALKNTVFNGIGYTVGSIIPAEAVLPSRVPALLRNGTIAKTDEVATMSAELLAQNDAKEVEWVELPIQTENGVLGLSASRADIIRAVEVLQMKKDDAVAAVAEIESEDALIIIDACNKNAEVKKAIKQRVAEITPAEDGDE